MNTYIIELTFFDKKIKCKAKANSEQEAKEKVIKQLVFTSITVEKKMDINQGFDIFKELLYTFNNANKK